MEKRQLGIYVHVPFCLKKCFYCDFLSAPALEAEMEEYFLALEAEISKCSEVASRYCVHSIFFGGGTPSLPSYTWIVRVLGLIRQLFLVEAEAEITIECNPETLDWKKLLAYREAGINRISFGLQSAENKELVRLGRVHTYERFVESFWMARRVGFLNCNVDLMFGLPGQTLQGWENTLLKVIALEPEHISAYSLIVEEGTCFFQMQQKGQLFLPDEEEEQQMYERTEAVLEEAGYRRYEISNYAKYGRECRHNLIYWTGQEYLGLGLGASSYMDKVRFRNTSDFEEYRRKGKDQKWSYAEAERLTISEQMEEFMFLGLRKMDGVSKAEFEERFGKIIELVYGDVIEKWKRQGMLKISADRIWLTREGILISNVVLADFLLS